MIIHTVTQGESVYSIARNYGVSTSIILKNNGITVNDTLVPGQALVILFPETTHRVSAGETLFSIAEYYNTTVNQLFFLVIRIFIPVRSWL